MKPDIKVVLRMFDADLAEKIERGFGIHTAFSASGLAAPAFAAAATRANIEYSFYVGDTLLHVSQVTVGGDSPLANMTMEEAERKFDMTIIMHNTGDHMHLHPQYDEAIHVNDTLVVFATLETLGKIGGMNHNHGQPHAASQNLLKRMFQRRPATRHG
jgi:Trk K+ transport system NAD-binding subunit